MTKPLDALDVVHLRFDGWATRNQTGQFLWDLLFYEPWFLGLGVLRHARRDPPPPPHRRLELTPSTGSWC